MIRMERACLFRWMLTSLFVLAIHAPAVGESIFADANLEEAVRQQVHDKRHSDEPLTASDVQNVATVNAAGRGITDLSGLEHCRSLASLNLSDNEIEDLSPLADLTRLQTLNLPENRISDLSPLRELTRLQNLDLADNEIADVSALAELTALRSLYLSNNTIENPSDLATLERLWSLYLDGNPVQDWSVVGDLPRLDTLDVSRTGLSDVEAIVPAISGLRLLMIEENEVSDVSALLRAMEEDADGPREFAPFLRVYLRENPLSDASKEQLEAAQSEGLRLTF